MRGSKIRRTLFAAYGALWLIGLIVAALVSVGLAQSIAVHAAVRRSGDAQLATSRVLKDLVDMETGSRGFVITGDDTFLAPYEAGRADLPAQLTALTGFVTGADQLTRIDVILERARQWDTEVLGPENGARRVDAAAAARSVASGVGKQQLDAIRADIDQVVAQEQVLGNQRLDQADRTNKFLQGVLAVAALLSVLIGGLGIVVIDRTVVRRVARLTAQADALGAGDLEVELPAVTGRDEIDQLGRAFADMRDRLRGLLLSADRLRTEADQASRAKSTFLANMSHELRTPLNAILGFTDLLEEQLAATLSDRQRTFVAHIRDAGQHLLALINDVLDLSKVEAGRLELRPERVSLRALVGPVIASAQADAATRDVAFSEEGLPDVELMLDAGRIRQVLYNLLSNAVKFTPAGGAVTLRAAVNDRSLRLEVSDTGVGIPEAQQHRVFGTFERIHESLQTAPGTGLGLALTKQLVELHRGTISFESAEGKGTRFTVFLPDAVVPAITGARVLVVENDPGDAALVVALAAAADLQAEVVPTVEEALNALARETPLGVVLDLRLPGSRGELLFEAMQRDPTMARVPVVVITVEEADSRNTKRLIGIDDYLTKPLDPARLAAWFKRLTERDP